MHAFVYADGRLLCNKITRGSHGESEPRSHRLGKRDSMMAINTEIRHSDNASSLAVTWVDEKRDCDFHSDNAVVFAHPFLKTYADDLRETQHKRNTTDAGSEGRQTLSLCALHLQLSQQTSCIALAIWPGAINQRAHTDTHSHWGQQLCMRAPKCNTITDQTSCATGQSAVLKDCSSSFFFFF